MGCLKRNFEKVHSSNKPQQTQLNTYGSILEIFKYNFITDRE